MFISFDDAVAKLSELYHTEQGGHYWMTPRWTEFC